MKNIDSVKFVPSLRFPEFRGDGKWENYNLIDLAKITMGQSPSSVYYTDNPSDYILIQGNADIKQGVIIPRVYTSYVTKMADISDIIFTVRAPVGVVAKSDYNAVIGRGVAAIKGNDFIYHCLEKMRLNSYWKSKSSGSTFDSINSDELKTTKIMCPSLQEQNKIADFLTLFNNLIDNENKKIENLRLYKQGLLQKMFVNNNNFKTPELRFPEFINSGDWEQRKLGELANIVRGASPRPIQDPIWFDSNSDVGWLRISDVTSQNGRIKYLEQRISKAGQSKTRVVIEPHLLLSIAASVGKPVINYIKTGVHDGFLIFMNPKFDIEFLYQFLDSNSIDWNKYGQPGSQVNLNSEIVKSKSIYTPSLPEQSKIGNLFKTIDDTIALHNRKLECLNSQKKCLMQGLFPKNEV